MNVDQLRRYIVRPVLGHLDYIGPHAIPYSVAAEQLVLGTILAESRGEYIVQVGGGPALGLGQIEPATHEDYWTWLERRPELALRIQELTTSAPLTRGALEMIGNNFYAVAMVRVHYRRLPDALAPERDPLAMAKLWKLRYNTPLGAGTVPKALPFFKTACGV